jgi:uncharacterized protein (TIGR03790 family)
MQSITGRIGRQALLLVGVLLVAAPAVALQPDQIALVVNARVPDGRALAELYAKERHIPEGRIIEIHFDAGSPISPAEEIPFNDYDAEVAGPVREFLIQHQLADKVTCLVTFWGVPLRIAREPQSAARRAESEQLDKELAELRASIGREVATLEQSAGQLDKSFKPQPGDQLLRLARRFDLSLTSIVKSLPTLKDSADRNARYSQILSTTSGLLGADRATQLMAQPGVALFSPHPPTSQDLATAQARLAEFERQIAQLNGDNANSVQREKARALARDNLGLFGQAFLANAQQELLSVDQTESALDSELALIWQRQYPRAKWVPNQLQWKAQLSLRQRHARVPPTLMVTRLDGPSQEIVRNIILTSARIEAEGLHGQIAIDARGKHGSDAYSEYDAKLRNLANLLQNKTTLKVTFEDTDALIPAHSLQDIAVYCGWYALRSYSSPGSFSPGAVGYHVASFELLSLRQPKEHGWVRGLLSDGVVGTLGPVSEPYLQSFPPADEFFPLLMTGKLTLAEVYWRTLPWGSWMQACIGDPLYTPYKKNPPLDVKDLLGGLAAALDQETTLPSTRPVR